MLQGRCLSADAHIAAAPPRCCVSRCVATPVLHHSCRERSTCHILAAQAGRQRRRPAGAIGIAAVSTPQRLTVTDRIPPPPPPELDVRAVGIGGRGSTAISKLVSHGKVNAADAWCVDVDKAVLDAALTANTVLLPKDEPGAPAEGRLRAVDLEHVVGRAASDAGGRGNINAGTDGAVAFVLAPAASAPGGAATVLQIVQALRAAGHFTVAAVTLPFAFEGAMKQAQADDLIAALQQDAHMVAVVEPDVLMQAFGDAQMTVAQATDIADNALVHCVRCILQAVQAPEILRSTRGALMWHGRDLRHFKRIISPPLQQLLTQPGTAVLGRGLASMPADAARQMGAAQALMHLASEAVRAAAESPFLDGALNTAGGVLCSITLPASSQQFATGTGNAAALPGMQTAGDERRVAQLAAQATAATLAIMSGPCCQDFVLCAQSQPAVDAAGDSSLVQVEVTLLVLRLPEGQGRTATGGARLQRAQLAGQQNPPYRVGPAVPPSPRQSPPVPQRLPASSWNMLSAMAGGSAGVGSKSAASAAEQLDKAASAVQQQPSAQHRQQSSIPTVLGVGRPRQQQQQQQQETVSSATPQQQQQVHSISMGQQVPLQATAAHQIARSEREQQQQQRTTVGDYLVNSLTARSLDLPPAAARWRQEHRDNGLHQRKLIVWEVDGTEPWEEEVEPQGLAALLPGRLREKRVNIKERMASILMQDREDAWEAESTSMDDQ